jgi:GNAT superfamily N-acetyltransferase
MEITFATTDEEITNCCRVMRELRPHIPEESFLARVRALKSDGYRLVALRDEATTVAVAGFRIGTSLAWGHYLYVDDLVTLPDRRSKGYGSALMDWLRTHAKEQGCGQLHLDSGMQRQDAHRFYEREGMAKAGYHFVERLERL